MYELGISLTALNCESPAPPQLHLPFCILQYYSEGNYGGILGVVLNFLVFAHTLFLSIILKEYCAENHTSINIKHKHKQLLCLNIIIERKLRIKMRGIDCICFSFLPVVFVLK